MALVTHFFNIFFIFIAHVEFDQILNKRIATNEIH
jgi:hypothetical protein